MTISDELYELDDSLGRLLLAAEDLRMSLGRYREKEYLQSRAVKLLGDAIKAGDWNDLQGTFGKVIACEQAASKTLNRYQRQLKRMGKVLESLEDIVVNMEDKEVPSA